MKNTRLAKEENTQKKTSDSSNDSSQDHDLDDAISLKPGNMKPRNDEDETSKPSSWKPKDLSNTKNDDLESAKAEMGEVMEENKRLKSDLDRIMKDYQSLQMRFHEFTRKQQESKTTPPQDAQNNNIHTNPRQSEDEPHELSLSLGRNPSLDSKNKNSCTELTIKERSSSGLSLALDYKKEAGETSSDEPKEEAGETWPPSKVLKTMKSGGDGGDGGRDDEIVQQPPVKKPRVSVRARCDTPTMNDGCQWRKYGQKIAKGNPCPRAYYRCTVAPSCPVRKQVQRCADDMSILITTYEGTHNHPLPISATAMASTTSAAAYMLISGSSTTNNGIGSNPNATTTSTNLTSNSNSNSNFSGLNFNMSGDASRSRPLFFNNSSFSPSPSQPTITLDLTTSSTSSSSASQFSKLAASTSFAPRPYPNTTNLTFNSLDLHNQNPNANNLPMSWSQSNLFSYNTTNPTSFNKNQVTRDQDSFYQTLFQKIIPNPNPNPNSSVDTLAAAAKAITSDPSFQSVLTSALSSLMGTNNNASSTSGIVNVDSHTSEFANMIKWGNQSSSTTSSLLEATNDGGTKGNINGCASSFVSIAPNRTTNAHTGGNLMVLSSPLPFPTSSRSTSTSPEDSRDNVN